MSNATLPTLDKNYGYLLRSVLNQGMEKNGTLSIPGETITHYFDEGFPLLTSKKMAFKSIVHELIWFIKGDTTIQYLVKNGVNIWTDNAYEHYKKRWTKTYDQNHNPVLSKEDYVEKIKTDDKFNSRWGDLGPVYGKQWRSWASPYGLMGEVDQLASAIQKLKDDPDSRSIMVSSWAVHYLEYMALKPCHVLFQFHAHTDAHGERLLSLTWYQRSVDLFLGLPFNIASYGLLLQSVAQELGRTPYKLQGMFGDVHIYNEHIDAVTEQLENIDNNPKGVSTIPKVSIHSNTLGLEIDDVILEEYDSYEAIRAPMIVTNKA